ncbi:hypothetical protein [Legionella sp. CNM-4043-24]|uniref:hypothetical protein n=1 Tax=Legionella sp. CNM-4043-24 TaxID=3421646 RepID=UPI00403A9313
MLKKIGSCLIVSLSCLSLTACGINASVEPMTYTYNTTDKPANKSLINHIKVSEVRGGHCVNPLLVPEISDESFKAALEKSLQSASLFTAKPEARYTLSANIVRFERPLIGLDFKSTLLIHYKLNDSLTHNTIYSKTISSSHTATMNDAVVGVTRVKLANEGAARENIRLLIKDLYKL